MTNYKCESAENCEYKSEFSDCYIEGTQICRYFRKQFTNKDIEKLVLEHSKEVERWTGQAS